MLGLGTKATWLDLKNIMYRVKTMVFCCFMLHYVLVHYIILRYVTLSYVNLTYVTLQYIIRLSQMMELNLNNLKL